MSRQLGKSVTINTYRIAVIAGDGIGKEVMPEGLRALEAVQDIFDFTVDAVEFGYASVEYFLEHGQMMPDGWFDELRGFDAIFFGAAGRPDAVPDHVSLWGSLLQFRRHFHQYVNLRPVELLLESPARSWAPSRAT